MSKWKALSVVLIILGVLCLMGGCGFSKLEEANQGASVSSVRVVDGEIVNEYIGNIGANPDGAETAGALSTALYIVGGISLFSGIIAYAVGSNKEE